MTPFDLLRQNQQPIARPARHARKSSRRVLGAHFECLEPRCLMSVAPPAPLDVAPDNAQYTSFYIAPLVPRVGGQYPSAPQPGQQYQLQPVEDAPSGIVIVRGMTDIAPLSLNSAQGNSQALSGIFNNQEARAVQEMLSSLKYAPAAPPAEIAQRPTFTPSAPTSAPSSPGSSHVSPTVTPSLGSAPSASSNSAPSSASANALNRQGAQRDTEGGMVSLVRQPIAQASAFDKISVAAIDALLEIPAKVDGRQGRFQAFEISVTTEKSLPATPPPAGAPIHLPVESTNRITLPATDPNLHGAWVPSDSAGAIPHFTLPSADFSTTSFLTAAASVAEQPSPFAELPTAAVDAVFGELSSDETENAFSIPRLDVATATLLAVVIGRALWPLRVPKAAEQEKSSNPHEPE